MHFSFLFLLLLLSASPYLFSFLFPLPSPLLLSPPLPIPSPLPFPSLLLSLNFTETQTTAVLRGNHPPWPSLFSWDWQMELSFCCAPSHLLYHSNRQGDTTLLIRSDSRLQCTLPRSPLLPGSLLCQLRCWLIFSERKTFLHWLLFSILLFHCPGNHRLLYVYSDGFWPRSWHPKSSSPG